MSNPPPARSWFRLPTLGRQPQPRPPSPPQQPRPPVLRPALAPSFRPPQPPTPTPPAPMANTPQPPSPSPQQPRPPVLRPAFAQSFRPTQPQPPPPATITTAQPPSPPPPPRVVSSPSPPLTSPKTANTTSPELITKQSPTKPPISDEKPPPPSSLNTMESTYPPKSSSYPAIESPGAIKPNKVVVHATFNKQAIVPNTSSQYGNLNEAGRRVLPSYSADGRSMKGLNIGGKNNGANMELGYFKQTDLNGNDNVGNEGQESEAFHRGVARASRLPRNADVNSNVQSVNNSLLIDCSITQHDPGVHFYLSKKPTKGVVGKTNVDEIGPKGNESRGIQNK